MSSRSRVLLGLLLATLAAYSGVLQCDFVGIDDGLYVSHNPYIREGFTWPAIKFALGAGLFFSSPNADYWAPLTVLSRIADIQMFGLDPRGHHLTNLLLHCSNVVLLFLLLDRLTGSLWRSAIVAAWLAVHPQHVESVAWITERKDLLGALFFILGLGAYLRYTAKPGPGRWFLVALLFLLGLLSKPMVMTFPFVLLLLDYWPLRRLTGSVAHVVLEKLPFFAMAAASVWITFRGPARSGYLVSLEALPLGARVANAMVAYAAYIGGALWPRGLATPYPHPEKGFGWMTVALAGGLLAVLSALALRAARSRPYLLVGWLWYLGMLVPVIGLVQSGPTATRISPWSGCPWRGHASSPISPNGGVYGDTSSRGEGRFSSWSSSPSPETRCATGGTASRSSTTRSV
jgi:protein O-mannosyl-transferase